MSLKEKIETKRQEIDECRDELHLLLKECADAGHDIQKKVLATYTSADTIVGLGREHEIAIVKCSVCGKHFGWWCPESDDGICEYKVGTYGCIHCGNPRERK